MFNNLLSSLVITALVLSLNMNVFGMQTGSSSPTDSSSGRSSDDQSTAQPGIQGPQSGQSNQGSGSQGTQGTYGSDSRTNPGGAAGSMNQPGDTTNQAQSWGGMAFAFVGGLIIGALAANMFGRSRRRIEPGNTRRAA